MAVFNCELNRRWCKESTAYAGVMKERNTPLISSNGYYGYLPIYSDSPSAMDTNVSECPQSNNVPYSNYSPCTGNNVGHTFPHNISNEKCIIKQISSLPRKRNSNEQVDENHKRVKMEESPFQGAGGFQVSHLQPTYNTDYHYPRCIMEPVPKCHTENIELERDVERSREDLSEFLLKHIHGCDMYNFYTTCDL